MHLDWIAELVTWGADVNKASGQPAMPPLQRAVDNLMTPDLAPFVPVVVAYLVKVSCSSFVGWKYS